MPIALWWVTTVGASISLNHGKTFQRVVLAIAQMYHVAVDDQIPYNVYGNRQDGYSYRGPSNSLQGYIPIGLWEGVGGCESGFAQPDPFDNDIVWSGCYDGGLERYIAKTGHSQDVRVWLEAGYAIFNKRLEKVNGKFNKFLNTDVELLNRQLQKSEFQILLDKGIRASFLNKKRGHNN